MIRLQPSFNEYVPLALTAWCAVFVVCDYIWQDEGPLTVVLAGLALYNLNAYFKERDRRKAVEKRINEEWQKERDAFLAALRKHMNGE